MILEQSPSRSQTERRAKRVTTCQLFLYLIIEYGVVRQKCLYCAILAPESNCSSARTNYYVMRTYSTPPLIPRRPRRPRRPRCRRRYYLDYCLLVALFCQQIAG